MRTVDEHLERILSVVSPGVPAPRPVLDCLGLTLTADVTSLVDLPGFDNSAMDGYAVRAADVSAADPARPETAVRLRVVGEVAAGAAATMTLRPGEAVRIMTGAMMPAGADAVVRVEDTSEHDEAGTTVVLVQVAPRVGQSVRLAGEDVRAGAVVLRAGDVLDPRRVALLTATGHPDAPVLPRPRVAVVSTGAELVEPGRPLAPGQIHDSNSYMLDALVRETGATTTHRVTVDDSPRSVLSALHELSADSDAIITSGGVSMGAYDVVKEVLRDSGTVEFVQVAMQPGKPQGFGTVGERGVPLFALPGNPVSAYVSFEVFVRPALRTMMGLAPVTRTALTATLTHELRSVPGRRQVARAVATRTAAGWSADPVWGQASHFVADLARANALVLVPEDVDIVPAGAPVEMWLLAGEPERIGT